MHIGALAWLTVLASMEGEKPEANMTFIALQVQIGAVVQGRNQDLNLAKKKYEILTCHKDGC